MPDRIDLLEQHSLEKLYVLQFEMIKLSNTVEITAKIIRQDGKKFSLMRDEQINFLIEGAGESLISLCDSIIQYRSI
jgi:hypothetical protein